MAESIMDRIKKTLTAGIAAGANAGGGTAQNNQGGGIVNSGLKNAAGKLNAGIRNNENLTALRNRTSSAAKERIATTKNQFQAVTAEANKWRYNADGSKKTFDQLTTPEVYKWIGTLDRDKRAAAARDFETNYLKNPGSTRYDPYYSDYSNNDEARQLFGVNTFDQKWIDDNRGYYNYLTFTNESYTTPKKPGKNATAEEQAAYQYWQIANTYENTPRKAEDEYARLREEIAEKVATLKATGDVPNADELIGSIDWSDYGTLEDLRESAAAGNARMLNRPVQVGDASIRSMVNAAIRGENVTENRNFVVGESQYIGSAGAAIQNTLRKAIREKVFKKGGGQSASEGDVSKNTNVGYDPYAGLTSNNEAAKEMFGTDVFDQEWIDANRDLMAYVTFKDQDDTEPVKPGKDATEQEKRAYEYWQIAHTYEKTTSEGEKELAQLQDWMQKKADQLGEDATADEIVGKIDWEDYPTLQKMREVSEAGNAMMLNRMVQTGDASVRAMAEAYIRGDRPEAAVKPDEPAAENQSAAPVYTVPTLKEYNAAQIEVLDELLNELPEDAEEREQVEAYRDQLTEINEIVTPENAAAGNVLAGGAFTSFVEQARTAYEERARAENSAREAAELEEKIYGSTELQTAEAPKYNEYVASLRATMGIDATIGHIQAKINELMEGELTRGLFNPESTDSRGFISYNTYDLSDEERSGYQAMMDELQMQLYLLQTEHDQRDAIAQETRGTLGAGGYTGGGGVLEWLWNRNYIDTLNDGDFVPLEDYEAFLRYRLTPATSDLYEARAHADMAKYDRVSAWEERAGLLAEGVATGMDKAATAATSGLEYVMYEIARRLPENQGKTKEEIYASSRELAALKGWNEQYSREYIDAETKQELAQEYPVFSVIGEGVSEMLKMTGQVAAPTGFLGQASGAGWYGMDLLANGGKVQQTVSGVLGRASSMMPFALDVYGSTYETAISEGATEDQAGIAAAINALGTGALSSAVVDRLGKLGRGAVRLFGSGAGKKAAEMGAAVAAKNGWAKAVLMLGAAALEEGAEEAIEEPIQGLIAKGVYDRDRAWTGEGGVFDANAMLQSGVGGAVAGTMFSVTSGLSGNLGQAAQTEAETIVEKTLGGQPVTQEEIDHLTETASREAAIQDRTEEIEAQSAAELEAATEKAEAAAEQVGAAQKKHDQAAETLTAEREANQPVLDELNNGTASYNDPEITKRLDERGKATKAAQEAKDAARQELAEAKENAAKAADEAMKTIARIHEAARAEATAQVDQEIQAEREAETQARAEEVKKEAERPAVPGVQYKNRRATTLSGEQQTQLRILDALGRKYGLEIDVVDTLNGANAMYGGGRKITVALDAAEKAYVQAGVHEMVHYVRNYSDGAFTLLESVVADHLTASGVDLNEEIDKRIEEYAGMQELTREQALEEIIAEAAPTVFTSEEAVRRLVGEDRSLAQKIRDFFVDFARTLQTIAQRYVDRNQRVEIAALDGNIEALMEIAETLDMALNEAGKAETGASNDTQFSLNKPVERVGDLVAVHNLSEANVVRNMDQGWMAGLSIGITKADQGHGFDGDVSFVFRAESVDPEANSGNRVFDRDADTGRYPKMHSLYRTTEGAVDRVTEAADRIRQNLQTRLDRFEKHPRINGLFKSRRDQHERIAEIKQGIEGTFDKVLDLLREGETGFLADIGQKTLYSTLAQNRFTEALYELETGRKAADGEEYREYVNSLLGEVLTNAGTGIERAPDRAVFELTPENLVNVMAWNAEKSIDAQELPSSRGYMQFGTLDEIRSESDRITPEGDEAGKKKVERAANGLLHDIMTYQSEGTKRNDAYRAMLEFMRLNEHIPEEAQRIFEQRGLKLDDEDADYLSRMAAFNHRLETPYFEAKLMREVGFDEVVAAIVPQDMDQSQKNRLAGLIGGKVVEYARGDKQSRLDALNGLEGVRFSLNRGVEQSEGEKVVEEVMAEEREEVQDDMTRLAKRVIKEYKSRTTPVSEAAAEIDAMVAAYQEQDEEAAARIAEKLAQRIVENSSETDNSLREQYTEIRTRLRTEGFSLTDVQKQEAANTHGSYNDWRKSVMGSVKVKNDAASLDAKWAELSDMAPEFFPADANEAQMPEYISAFVQRMKPQYSNPYGFDTAGAAADLNIRLQADVLEILNKGERAGQLRAESDSLRERTQMQTEERAAARKRKQQEQFAEIAGQMREARDQGDAKSMRELLDRYRNMRGGQSRAADAIEAGIVAREYKKEARRLEALIGQIDETLSNADADADRSKLNAEKELYEKMREDCRRIAARLNRQEVIDRAGMDALEEGPEWDAVSTELYHEMNEDMSEMIDEHVVEMRGRIQDMWTRGEKSQQDFNMTSTLTEADKVKVFEDLEGEIIQQSELKKVWHARYEAARSQMVSEESMISSLRNEIRRAREKGDVHRERSLMIELQEATDRKEALTGQMKRAEAQEKYCARTGAESLQQALREGRLPQPIMERVIAVVKDSGRRGAFNRNAIVEAFDTERLTATTAARVWDDIFGEAAPLMRAVYYDPVMDNESARQKWIADWRKRLGALKLTKEESYQVQKLGEGRMSNDEQAAVSDKVRHAVKEYRAFYEEAHAMAKRALVRNGYDAPGYITDYFPHLDIPRNFLEKIGIPIEHAALPTSINGMTESFRPGKQYSSHLLTRKGETTDYDAMYGFEEYIGAISGVIFHTDDIQRHRQLESEIRAAARSDKSWPERNVHGESFFANHFVNWLNEYTNLLAGKKSAIDRGAEKVAVGRVVYAAATKLKSIKGANAVMGNIASAVTNVIPVTQVLAEEPVGLLKGAAQMVKEGVSGRGNRPESQFLTRRFGSDSIVQTAYSRFSKFFGKPFELVDMLASNLVVNTYYQANLDMGMDSETAMRSADSKAARLMGDRSKGAMPNMYGSQIVGFLSQFQYEVANQSQHFRKDIWRAHGAGKGLITLLMTALTGFLWNNVNEKLTGRRPAADPIQMVIDLWETAQDGKGALPIVQATYNNVSEMFPYLGQGRIAATESIVDLLTTVFEDGTDMGDVGYAARQAVIGMIPMGGQIKKTWRGAMALMRGGYYNTAGNQLRFPVDNDPLTAAQALVFGPTSIQAARDYYAGDAAGLTVAQTRNYEQMKQRGATSTEAYRNEADKAAADRLMSEASKAENANAEEMQAAEVGHGTGKETDLSGVADQRNEAAKLRNEAVPGEMLTDYWWSRRDEPGVKAAIEYWRQTGETWALPKGYGWDTEHTISKKPRYLGDELAAQADQEYELGYREIMDGVDLTKLDEEEAEEIKKALEKLKRDIDARNKERIIEERGEEVDW